MNIFIISIISLCLLSDVAANSIDTTFTKIINKQSPLITFNVKVTSTNNKNYYLIKEYEAIQNSLLQIIEDSTDYTLANMFDIKDPKFSIELIDINFDKYLDLKLYNYSSVNGQSHAYKYWLYDISSAKYIYNEEFSENLSGIEVYLDTLSNLIITPFNSSNEQGQDRYKVLNNKLILYETEGIFFDYDKNSYYRRLIRNVNGQMKIIKEEPFSYED